MTDRPAPTVAALRANPPEREAEVTLPLLLRRVAEKTSRTGSAYLVVDVGDRTGSLTLSVFGDQPACDVFRAAQEGDVFLCTLRSDTYQGRWSPKVAEARAVSEADAAARGWLDALVEVAPEDPAVLERDLREAVALLQPEALRATVEGVLEELGSAFLTAPAANSMHHAYRSGLLEHTVHMVRAARAVLPLYPEVEPSLALAGVILHDAGKALEYDGGLGTRKTRLGQLQGHVVLGYRLVRKAALRARLPEDLAERLEHIILSHQGEPEWGAAVYAATPEAVFVSLVDNLDAKMGMVQRALRQGAAREGFSEFLPGLSSPLLVEKPGGAPGA